MNSTLLIALALIVIGFASAAFLIFSKNRKLESKITFLKSILEKERGQRILFEIKSLSREEANIANIQRLYEEYKENSEHMEYQQIFFLIRLKLIEKYQVFIQDPYELIAEIDKDAVAGAGLISEIKQLISQSYQDKGVIGSFQAMLRRDLSKRQLYDAEERFKKVSLKSAYLIVGKKFEDFYKQQEASY